MWITSTLEAISSRRALPTQRFSTPPKLVVTADRELRRRCADVGAVAVGPRWLLDLVEQPR